MTDVQAQLERGTVVQGRAPARLVACCLLDGGVRASPLVAESGCSVLDLDVGPDRRLLDVWLDALGELHWGTDRPVLRVLHGGSTPAPRARPTGVVSLDIRADSDSYRGPAGVVRDGMWDQPADGALLVCEAGRYLVPSGGRTASGTLADLVRHHESSGADVTIAREAGGAPAGLLVLNRWTLDVVAEKGFVDMKEQWLGRVVARGCRVLVHDLGAGTVMSVRTRLDLLQAARVEGGGAHDAVDTDACRALTRLNRRLTPGWSISRGASIGPGAVVARSVVMDGAKVGEGAVVSSSLVLPGAVVAPGSLVVDRVLT